MLVLTRKLSESIKIGNDVVITVTQIAHGRVKLGIQAPPHVRIVRTELTDVKTATSSAADKAPLATHTELLEEATTVSNCEFPLDFSTDYAVEIEDQMLCLHAH